MASCTPVNGTRLTAEHLVDMADNETPLLVTAPKGDSRLFVVARNGFIRIIKDGQIESEPFLDVRGNGFVASSGSGERGLLGVAFHPDYARNGQLYVYYTTNNANVITEYKVSAADPDKADPKSKRVLLSIPDTQSNHNGGMVEFGPDGMLFIGTGDGGGQHDNQNHAAGGNAQNQTVLLGKLLRIDVDTRTGNKPYGIPGDNPNANSPGGAGDPKPEIWATGLRNPWRFSFDAQARMLYIGDVGQDDIEEVDVVQSTQAGLNFGWRVFEADCFHINPQNPNDHSCDHSDAGFVFPVAAHSHGDGWASVIGGQVYRGTCFPGIVGWYFYSDISAGEVWKFRWQGNQAADHARVNITGWPGEPTSIHADGFGELYVTDLSGGIYHIVARP